MGVQRRSVLLLSLFLACVAASCGGGDAEVTGDPPGGACQSDAHCGNASTRCYAAGTSSSCEGGGLCIGTATTLTCAARCDVDADCAGSGASSVCLVGCEERLLRGFCVEPSARDDLLTDSFCTTPGERRQGVAGSWQG